MRWSTPSVRMGIGVDAELLRPLDRPVRELVCTSADANRKNVRLGGRCWSKMVFSAKDSFYKAIFPLFRTPLGFHDVEIELQSDSRFVPHVMVDMPAGFERLHVRGTYRQAGNLILTGVTVLE